MPSVVYSRNGLNWQRAMDALQFNQVELVPRSSCDSLECDQAGKRCDACLLTAIGELDCAVGHRSEVDRRVARTQDVDLPKATIDTHRLCVCDRAGWDRRSVAPGLDVVEKAGELLIKRVVVVDQQVNVLSAAHILVGDNGESADHYVWQADFIRSGYDSNEIGSIRRRTPMAGLPGGTAKLRCKPRKLHPTVEALSDRQRPVSGHVFGLLLRINPFPARVIRAKQR